MAYALPPEENANSSILTLHRVSKTYHMGELDVPVLHNVNLDFQRGEISVIVGPSGSGKSTLLNIMGGIDTPTDGEVFFDGKDLSAFSERQLTAYRRHSIGFVFQFYNLVPTLTATENVMVSTEISNQAMDPVEALARVGLSHRLEHFPAQLSGGEQQRVAIARAIAKNPQLLLCDEPTGALDLDTGRSILQSLVQLNKELGTTTIIITHNSAIAGISHRRVRLGSGTIADDQRNPNQIDADKVNW